MEVLRYCRSCLLLLLRLLLLPLSLLSLLLLMCRLLFCSIFLFSGLRTSNADQTGRPHPCRSRGSSGLARHRTRMPPRAEVALGSNPALIRATHAPSVRRFFAAFPQFRRRHTRRRRGTQRNGEAQMPTLQVRGTDAYATYADVTMADPDTLAGGAPMPRPRLTQNWAHVRPSPAVCETMLRTCL